jgi:OOP family OmpA-OmpF porin
MFKKTGLLAGLAIGCVLSAPAAFAEEYKGFYFGVWGGSGDSDFFSKGAYDQAVIAALPGDIANIPLSTLTLTGVGNSDLDDSLSVWGAQLGYRFNKFVAVEFGYVDLGELLYTLPGSVSGTYRYQVPCNCTENTVTTVTVPLNGSFERATQITSSGITGSVLGLFPISPKFDLHVRGGLYMADTRVTDRIRYVSSDPTLNIAHGRTDASQTELFGGLGAAWNINESFTLRVEYQKFFDVGDDKKTGESDVDVLNVAVLFK